MEAADGWNVLNARTSAFCDALRADLARVDPSIEVVSRASLFWIVKRDPGSRAAITRVDLIPEGQGAWFRTFFHAALKRGVYLPPSGFEVGFLSLAHDRATLDEARIALAEAAEETSRT
jgi:glutamate-1-semialdehyde 2,1-aminomutase